MKLDPIDREIINRLQSGFPLCQRPFAKIAASMVIDEDELIARLDRMRQAGVITRFGPFLDAAAMGGAFCLCAIEVPTARYDAVTELVNSFAEVAHNYARDHRLNMWFVLATETQDAIGRTAAEIEKATGLEVYQFPKLKEFFIGFRVAA